MQFPNHLGTVEIEIAYVTYLSGVVKYIKLLQIQSNLDI